jgi:nucleoside-diphosphate kinase
MIQQTLVLIKPDGVQRGLVGRIIQRFEDIGLKIVGMKMIWVDTEKSKTHYSDHVTKTFYKSLEEFITCGPVAALVFEGVEAVEVVRKIVGPTEPRTAPPGTIRGDFAHMSASFSNKRGIAVKNLIHASGNVEEAEKEINIWFDRTELHSYNVVHQIHSMG